MIGNGNGVERVAGTGDEKVYFMSEAEGKKRRGELIKDPGYERIVEAAMNASLNEALKSLKKSHMGFEIVKQDFTKEYNDLQCLAFRIKVACDVGCFYFDITPYERGIRIFIEQNAGLGPHQLYPGMAFNSLEDFLAEFDRR